MSAAEGFEEFVSIVEAGSLTAAAREMGLPRPTLSRRLARLEDRLGVRLLHRTARRLALTAQGQALFPTAREVVHSAREVEHAVRRLDGVPRGRLRISIPMGMPLVVAGWMSDYLERYPEVRLETVAMAEHRDLVLEGVDVALRFGAIKDPSLIARTVFTARLIAVATPEYLERRGTPLTPKELASHDCLIGFRGGQIPDPQWPLQDGGTITVSGVWASNDMTTRLHGALRHRGITLVTDRSAQALLDEGRLAHLLADSVGTQERVSVVYPDRTYVDPKVRAFVDLLVDYFTG